MLRQLAIAMRRASRTRRRRGTPQSVERLETRVVLSSAVLTTYTTVAEFNTGTYTVSEDFAKGVVFNVNASDVADQLQLDARLSTFPVMWIANSGDPSISKWDTTTNKELARYFTHFAPSGQPGYSGPYGSHSGPAPSRTAVDREGNVYVANRHFDGGPAEVIKILASGGIDRNQNGRIDTSEDVNGDGNIGDSQFNYDDGEILPLADTNGNGVFDNDEIQDERIAWVVQVGPDGGLGRSLAIDVDGNIWLGLYTTQAYYKLSGETGAVLAGPIDVSDQGHTPYGAQIDGNGILWGASLGSTLLRLDTNTNEVKVYDHSAFGSDYGIAIGNGKVYMATYSGRSYIEFDPVAETFSNPAEVFFSALGVAVDRDGNIVVGNDGGGVTKFAPDGSVVWTAAPQPGTNDVRGTVIDSNNDVWLIHLTNNRVSKHSGVDGAPLGVFETGNAPYTYTDATGLTRFTSTNPSGRWNVVQDGGKAGNTWERIFWNTEAQASEPAGTTIVVEARVADTREGLEAQAYAPVSNNGTLNLQGQFIEVRVTLNATANLASPVLSDITIVSEAGEVPVIPVQVVTVAPQFTTGKTWVVVTFSQALDTDSATRISNFEIICRGPDGRFSTRDARAFVIRRAVYDPATNTVTLKLNRKLPHWRAYQLTINGDDELAIKGANGLKLDGTNSGAEGSDHRSTFGGPASVQRRPTAKRLRKTPKAEKAVS